MLSLRCSARGKLSRIGPSAAAAGSVRRFGKAKPNMPPDYRITGFPIMDPDHPKYDPTVDPFNPLSEGWTMQGPHLVETDMDDPKRLDALTNIPFQGKTATEKPVFDVIHRTIREFHRAPPDEVPVRMSSRWKEDLGLDSLDINELSIFWEDEFCLLRGRGHNNPDEYGAGFRDEDVFAWETVGDVVRHVTNDPRCVVNTQTEQGWEFHYWEPFNLEYKPDYSHFKNAITDDGQESLERLNPSGIPEFAPRRDGKSSARQLPPDPGVIDDSIVTYDFGPAGLGGACR